MGLGNQHQSGGNMKNRGLRGPLFYSRWTGLAALVSVVLALGILFKLQSLVPKLDSEAPGTGSSDGPGSKPLVVNKVAFLFLVRHQMPLDFVWQHFFQEAPEEEYTVYIHARPSFVYTKNNTKCSAFIDRQLKKPVVVEWGEASMLQAERLLLKEALEDPLNQRFILLSDSCVPLFNFRYVYDYVMFSKKSFVDSFTDPRDYQYNSKMAPAILKAKWRKGSQWFVLIRKHAVAVVQDTTVFPVFQQYCKKMALPEFAEITKNNRNHNCIPDEHYLQTLLAMRNMETEIEQRGVTYSQWKSTHQHTMDRRGWHPITFDAAKTTLQAIIDIQDIKEIHFVAASRREHCGLGRRELPCYLFARKFTRGLRSTPYGASTEYEAKDKETIFPSPQRRVTRQGAIQKKASRTTTAVVKPTYFSLLADVEHALKVEHTEGASLQMLKRELEQKYGGKRFDFATNNMLKSAMKRLRKRGRIAKIHPNSTLFRFNPPIMPSNYNFFGPGPTHSKVPPLVKAKSTPSKQSVSMSKSVTMSRSTTRGSRSRSTTQGSMSTIQGSMSTTQGSMSTASRSLSSSIVKPSSRGLSVRNLASSARKKKLPIWRRR